MEAVLPPGFFGDPSAVPKCTHAQLDGQHCPAASQIGDRYESTTAVSGTGSRCINMVPPPGVPDEFAISIGGFHGDLRRGCAQRQWLWDRRARHHPLRGNCGYPGEYPDVVGCSRGNKPRPMNTGPKTRRNARPKRCPGANIHTPFLTLPTSCAGPQAFSARELSTWNNEEDPDAPLTEAVTHDDLGEPVGFYWL